MRDSRSAAPFLATAGSLLIALAALAMTAPGCKSAAPEQLRVVPQVTVMHPRRLQFSPTDPHRLLVMEAAGLVGVWNVTHPTKPTLFASIRAMATDARFAPDGETIVTVGIDGHVRSWGTDGTLRWTSTERHDGWARTVAVTANRIVTGGEDGKIRFWTRDGAVDGAPLAAHPGAVLSVDVAANGNLVSLGMDETLRLWKAGTQGGTPSYTEQELFRQPSPRYTQMLPSLLRLDVQWGWDRAALFSPRGDLIVAAMFDGHIRLFSADGTPRTTLQKAHKGHHVRALDFSADGTMFASVGFNGGVQVWNVDGTPRGAQIEAHRGPGSGVAISPDGKHLATDGVDDALRVWGIDGAALGDFPRPYSDRVRMISMAPQSRMFALAEAGGGVNMWYFDGVPHAKPLTGHRGAADAVAFSPQGDLIVSGGKDQLVRVADRDGKDLAPPFAGHVDGVISVAVSPDSKLIASGSRNDSLRIWDQQGKQLHALTGLRDMITDIVFSPDGKVFAAADAPGEIMMWNSDGSVRTNVFKAHNGFLAELAFSPDGKLVASGGADNAVKLWNLDGSPAGEPLTGHLAPVQAVAFTPDGRIIASGSLDGTVRLWNPATRAVRVLFVGVAVNQLGFIGSQMWVRANGETLLFYNPELQLQATLVLRRDAVMVITPDGWFAGPMTTTHYVRVFTPDGRQLSPEESGARFSFPHVRYAVNPRQ